MIFSYTGGLNVRRYLDMASGKINILVKEFSLRAHSEITPYFRAQFSQNSSGIARGLDFLIDANPL